MSRNIHITILFSMLFIAPSAYGQVAGGLLSVTDVSAGERDGAVTVSFTASVSDDAVGNRERFVFQPVLTDGTYRVSLPAVMSAGKNVRQSLGRAGNQPGTADASSGTNEPTLIVPGEPLRYTASVEAQSWMHGGQLYIEGVTVDCTVEYRQRDLLLFDSLRLYDEPQPTEIVTEVRKFAPRTVADSLASMFTFVVPESLFDPEDPFRIYDEEREGALIVYYHRGQYDIVPEYRDNDRTLLSLTAVTGMILDDPQSRVERVVVAGFASPEGAFEVNDVLAFNRAVRVKQHLLETTGLRDDQVWIYNGSVDWRGLRLLVERSDLPQKAWILDVIERVPAGAGRLEELKRIDGGAAYARMLENFFPLLRNGAFIKVYYSNELGIAN